MELAIKPLKSGPRKTLWYIFFPSCNSPYNHICVRQSLPKVLGTPIEQRSLFDNSEFPVKFDSY